MMQDTEKKKIGRAGFYFIFGLDKRNTHKHTGKDNGWGFLGTPGMQCEPVKRRASDDKAGGGRYRISNDKNNYIDLRDNVSLGEFWSSVRHDLENL